MTTQTALDNRFIRRAGLDKNAATILARAQRAGQLPVKFAAIGDPNTPDYANIDLALTMSTEDDRRSEVDSRLGFGGWTPGQRRKFLDWLHESDDESPLAFQDLYLANLEIRLFESRAWRDEVQTEVLRLHQSPAWAANTKLARVAGLVFWLRQDGDGLTAWLATCSPPPSWVGVALGWQALLGAPIHAKQAAALLDNWRQLSNLSAHANATPPAHVLALHLDSLTNALDDDPLAYALAALDPVALQPRPWRGVHRDLRLLIPQPDVMQILKPLLLEIAPAPFTTDADLADIATKYTDHDGVDGEEATDWHLILEFRQSRSEYFQMALALAQRDETFTQLMDEDRRLVYRVMYRKGKLRNFWRLWEYVKSWSSTRVYIRGEEVETWKVYPYSQFMR